MEITYVNPAELGPAQGFSHGVSITNGRLLFVSGQIARNEKGEVISGNFAAQFDKALDNILTVVRKAGGGPRNVVRLTIYVLDKQEYGAVRKEIGVRYREKMGDHYPAMTLVEVKGLWDSGAKLELEATAVV